MNDEAQQALQSMRVAMHECRIRREAQIKTHLLHLMGIAFAPNKANILKIILFTFIEGVPKSF